MLVSQAYIDSTYGFHLDDFLQNHRNVIIDFWATWCRPCLEMEPRISELSKEYYGQVAFAKMNTDENPRVSKKFKINAIPAILAFKDGELVDKTIGAISKRELVKFIADAFHSTILWKDR